MYAAARGNHLEIVRYLVENEDDIYFSDDIMWFSAENGHLAVVKYFFENGADIHYRDDSALLYSAAKGHLDVVKYLLENGANISVLPEEYQFELIRENVVVNKTGSKIMQDAWDDLVKDVKDKNTKVLERVKTASMEFLLKPDSIRVKIMEHQFTHKDDREEYKYMD